MAYQKRRKTTYYINKGVNQKSSKYTKSDAQVDDLRNLDFHEPNALTKRPGSTAMVSAATSGPINSIFEFERANGASYLVASSDTAFFYLNGSTWSDVQSGYTNQQPMDFLTFNDRLYAANGQTFVNWTGETLFPYMMPQVDPTGVTITVQIASGNTFLGLAPSYLISTAFVLNRQDGYLGPVPNQIYLRSPIVVQGISSIAHSNFNFPSGVGVSQVSVYMSVIGLSFNPGSVDLTPDQFGNIFVPLSEWRFITNIANSEQTFVIGAGDFNWPDVYDNVAGINIGFSGQPFVFNETYTPKYIEIADNRLFMAGFSAAPSVEFFSEIGQPEIVFPESFFEVRTDDGDRITGHKNFNDELIVFKRHSFHKLLGDSANNYDLSEISTEYGALSNKAIVEYRNKLLFLDEKGIVEFNGASWDIISHEVEPIFRRMNIEAAIENAAAVHYDFRNQIWFGIPLDDSTENNFTVVYDYLIDAWTFFDGFNPASFAMAKQGLSRDNLWVGDYSGQVSYFSPSFFADNGTGITCLIETKFDSPDGANVQNMYRQLFLDVNTPTGVTGKIDVEVFSDYTASAKATFSVFQNSFQTKKDFGVQGKSVAFRMTHNSESLPLTIYGYTVRRRFLREV